MAQMPGDPPYGWPVYPWLGPVSPTPWYPQHWDAPSDPKVLEVALGVAFYIAAQLPFGG